MILGSTEEIEAAKAILEGIPLLKNMVEAKARILLQDAIDKEHLKVDILYLGNRVWSRRKILQNLKRIMEKGALYSNKCVKCVRSGDKLSLPAVPDNFKPVLSRYFYDFLIFCCGSEAHYNLAGWIGSYPTVEDLKQFFRKNEYGKPVSEWIPAWKTDALRIVEDVERTLSPFQSFMKAKRKERSH